MANGGLSPRSGTVSYRYGRGDWLFEDIKRSALAKPDPRGHTAAAVAHEAPLRQTLMGVELAPKLARFRVSAVVAHDSRRGRHLEQEQQMDANEFARLLERLYREKPDVFRRLSSVMRLPEAERLEALQKLVRQ